MKSRIEGNDVTLSENDRAFVEAAMKDAIEAAEKRRKEFCAAIMITDAEYEIGARAHERYVELRGSKSPFCRAPIAKEAFIAGYFANSGRLK